MGDVEKALQKLIRKKEKQRGEALVQ